MSKAESNVQPLYSTFTFIGTANLFKDKQNSRFYTSNANDATAEYLNSRMSFGVRTSDTNMPFIELSGGYKKSSPFDIKTMDKDKNKMEVKWSDRKNPNVLKDVANWRMVRINLQNSSLDDCEKFLCSIGSSCYDAVEYLKPALVEGSRIYVSGNVEYSRYKNKDGIYKIGVKYVPNIIRLAKDNEDNKAEGIASFVFDKDSWDEGALTTDKKVYINTFVTCYDRESEQNIFIPLMYTFDCTLINFENEQHKRIFDYFKKCFEAKKDEYYITQWHCYVKQGFNMQDITMDDLSPTQKIQIEIGMKTFEQTVKDMQNGVVKERINDVQLYSPTNAFGDGEVSELSQYIEDDFFIPEALPKEEKLDNIQQKDDGEEQEVVNDPFKAMFPQP